MDATPALDNLSENEPNSPLLSLPAELRVSIYHFCLTSEDRVWIDANIRPPALLSTCREVRSETSLIYYCANTFHMDVRDCDTRLFQAYVENISLPKDVIDMPNWRLGVVGIKWANLMDWCRAVWDEQLPATKLNPDATSSESIVQMATDIASRGLRWDVVVELLNGLKVVAGNLDKSWIA